MAIGAMRMALAVAPPRTVAAFAVRSRLAMVAALAIGVGGNAGG